MAVASSAPAMLDDTGRAFDSVASEYDRTNTANPLLRAMRERTLHAVRAHVTVGSRVIDLGCGPGADGEALAHEGYRVTAIDWAPEMVSQTRARIDRHGLQDRFEVQRLGIQELDRLPAGTFDAAYSNFGPLNCVPDLPHVARALGERLRPGGLFIASVIGRIVPWELARYLIAGDIARARIRFARGFVPVPLNGRRVWTRYYLPGEFARPFTEAGFVRLSTRSLGLFTPPPYLEGFARRHERIVRVLQRLDDAAGGWPGVRACGDHFLIVMRRP